MMVNNEFDCCTEADSRDGRTTPTTESVRWVWVDASWDRTGTPEGDTADFNHWLHTVKREAWLRGVHDAMGK